MFTLMVQFSMDPENPGKDAFAAVTTSGVTLAEEKDFSALAIISPTTFSMSVEVCS